MPNSFEVFINTLCFKNRVYLSVESKLYSNRTMVTKQTDTNPSVTGENMVVYLKILYSVSIHKARKLLPIVKEKNKIKTDTQKVAL